MKTGEQHNPIEADMVQPKCPTNQVVSEGSSMGTNNSIQKEHLQSILQDGSTLISGALKNLTNDLEDSLGYIVIHNDSTAFVDGAFRAPTAPDCEQDKAATESENLNRDAEGDRGSATTSAGRGYTRLEVRKMTAALDPPLAPSADSMEKLPSYQTLPTVPAVPQVLETSRRQQISVIGEGLKTNGRPVRERQDECSAEQRGLSAVEKASYAAIEAMMASQASSSVVQEDSQPLSCSSSSSAPMTVPGHKITSGCAEE